MNELTISSLDAARILNCIEKARSGGMNAPVNLAPLMNELNRAVKVKPEKIPGDVVTMNSIVKLHNSKTNKVMEIQIVYPQDADISKNKVSIFAPVGTALLGNRKGTSVLWTTPAGSVELKILDIVYQPEANGDIDL
ncbi:MAG: nucleoside diphosphate kinase regulator [Chloroflexota bacterium]|jgi:regulator of nucleoside diphosphate kinase|nr:nucleoside diphosphate kinase regulator [Lentimicrobium sp.]